MRYLLTNIKFHHNKHVDWVEADLIDDTDIHNNPSHLPKYFNMNSVEVEEIRQKVEHGEKIYISLHHTEFKLDKQYRRVYEVE